MPEAIIVGAGFIETEMSEALRILGIDTHVIDLLPVPLPDGALNFQK